LLVFSGLGALLSDRYAARRDRALVALFAALAALAVAFHALGPGFFDAWIGAPVAPRIALAIAALAPVGLCLGAFLPLGIRSVAAVTPYRREYVAWAWAVNAFCSVVASVLATILAMSFGFRALLFLALAIYAVGILALRGWPEPAAREAAGAAPEAGTGRA
jgi:MFS family permease